MGHEDGGSLSVGDGLDGHKQVWGGISIEGLVDGWGRWRRGGKLGLSWEKVGG